MQKAFEEYHGDIHDHRLQFSHSFGANNHSEAQNSSLSRHSGAETADFTTFSKEYKKHWKALKNQVPKEDMMRELYLLYRIVTRNGGYLLTSRKEEWEQIGAAARLLKLYEKMSSRQLRAFYSTHLHSYETLYFEPERYHLQEWERPLIFFPLKRAGGLRRRKRLPIHKSRPLLQTSILSERGVIDSWMAVEEYYSKKYRGLTPTVEYIISMAETLDLFSFCLKKMWSVGKEESRVGEILLI